MAVYHLKQNMQLICVLNCWPRLQASFSLIEKLQNACYNLTVAKKRKGNYVKQGTRPPSVNTAE